MEGLGLVSGFEDLGDLGDHHTWDEASRSLELGVESYESPQQLGVILPHPHPNVSSLTLPPLSIGSRHACLWTSYLSA